MNNVTFLRESIRKLEDKKITIDQLGRDVFHVARELDLEGMPSLRQTLFRLANRLRALAERSLHDDVRDDLKDTVDTLTDELVELTPADIKI